MSSLKGPDHYLNLSIGRDKKELDDVDKCLNMIDDFLTQYAKRSDIKVDGLTFKFKFKHYDMNILFTKQPDAKIIRQRLDDLGWVLLDIQFSEFVEYIGPIISTGYSLKIVKFTKKLKVH